MINCDLIQWPGWIPPVSGGPSAPPEPLNYQLRGIQMSLGLPLPLLADVIGISTEILEDLMEGQGSLAVFCRVIKCLKLQVEVRSWDYMGIVPLGCDPDPLLLCGSLKDYKDSILRKRRFFSFSRGAISSESIAAVDQAESTITLKEFSQYVEFLGAKARLVYVVGDPSTYKAVLAPKLNLALRE
jgi:hypothetical protein